MSKLLVIVGHADKESFTHALALRYEQAASAAGASTELLDLSSLQFDPVLHSARGVQAMEPDLQRAQASILAAAHVAWFFPTWWAAPPALVKGFVDRTFLPGFAYRYEPGRLLQHKLLRGRSARLVTTMDAPWWYYALFYRSALHASFVHATLAFCGFAKVHTTTAYGLRNWSVRQRERLLHKLSQQGRDDARALASRLPSLRSHAQPCPTTRATQASDGSNNSSAAPSAMR